MESTGPQGKPGFNVFNLDGKQIFLTKEICIRIAQCINACEDMEDPQASIGSMQYCHVELLKQIKIKNDLKYELERKK